MVSLARSFGLIFQEHKTGAGGTGQTVCSEPGFETRTWVLCWNVISALGQTALPEPVSVTIFYTALGVLEQVDTV